MVLWLIRQARVAVVRGGPRIRAMTHATVLRGIEVARVLAGGYCAVVAGRTRSKNLIMVHGSHRFPDGRAVAILADVGRLHMQRALAGGFGAVVAAEAIVHDVDVVEVGGQPRDCRVAVIAVIAASDMRRVFAGRNCAVMTGAACANDLGVVDEVGRYPDVRGMAVFAHIGRLDVCRVLARSVGAVMAAGTIARNIYVVEICRQPADC